MSGFSCSLAVIIFRACFNVTLRYIYMNPQNGVVVFTLLKTKKPNKKTPKHCPFSRVQIDGSLVRVVGNPAVNMGVLTCIDMPPSVLLVGKSMRLAGR